MFAHSYSEDSHERASLNNMSQCIVRYSELLVDENYRIFISRLYLAPSKGVTLSEFCEDVS